MDYVNALTKLAIEDPCLSGLPAYKSCIDQYILCSISPGVLVHNATQDLDDQP